MEQQNVSLADKAASAAETAQNAPAVAPPPEVVAEAIAKEIDLDSLDSFTFQGKKYTPEELRGEVMMRKEFTKKTQELKKFEKFEKNLQFDLDFVRKNPESSERFKQIYPDKYHALLDVILEQDESARDSGKDIAQVDLQDLPKPLLNKVKELEDKLESVDRYFYEQKVQANQSLVNKVFSENSDKYPYANEHSVTNKALSLMDMNKDNPEFEMSDATWDRLFKLDHQENEKRFTELYKKRVDAQLLKSEKAKDSGPGGLAPGRERKKIAFGDIADIMIQDLSSRS